MTIKTLEYIHALLIEDERTVGSVDCPCQIRNGNVFTRHLCF